MHAQHLQPHPKHPEPVLARVEHTTEAALRAPGSSLTAFPLLGFQTEIDPFPDGAAHPASCPLSFTWVHKVGSRWGVRSRQFHSGGDELPASEG